MLITVVSLYRVDQFYKPLHISNYQESSFLNPDIHSQKYPNLKLKNGSIILTTNLKWSKPLKILESNSTTNQCSICKRQLPFSLPLLQHFSDSRVFYPVTFVDYLKAAPVTLFLGMGMGIIWFCCWNNDIGVADVGISYKSVFEKKEFFRFFSSSFSHISLLHFGLNCSSLFNLIGVEMYYGSFSYLLYVLFVGLFFISSLTLWLSVFTLLVTLFLQKKFYHESHLDTWGIGFSCVLFAFMTIHIFKVHGSLSFFGISFPTFTVPLLSIPMNFYPFFQLLLMKIVIPNSSFLGHLSGILLGYFDFICFM